MRAHLRSDEFELEEFPEGWRVVRPIPEGTIGTSNLAVERASGALLEFSSGLPPRRIIDDFEEVRSEAYVIDG